MWIFGLYPIEISHQPVVSFWMIKYSTKIISVQLFRGKIRSENQRKYTYWLAAQQTAMEALLLFVAFPSLLQGAPKILVGGHGEEQCLPREVPGREKVFCSHASGLQPSTGWGPAQSLSSARHVADPPLWCLCCSSSPTTTYGSDRLVHPDPKTSGGIVSVAFHKGWREEPYPRLLAYQTLCRQWES